MTLERRLERASERPNPELSSETLTDVPRKVLRVEAAKLVERNRVAHRMLVDGVPVEYRRNDGSISVARVRVIEFEEPENNDWLTVNQFTVVERQYERRPDIVIFVNGLPLAVIELKNPTDVTAAVSSAYKQLQTYQAQIPALIAYNVCMIASDGVQARIGALGAGKEWFNPWRTIDDRGDASPKSHAHLALAEGMIDEQRTLEPVRGPFGLEIYIGSESVGDGRCLPWWRALA